jgi:hypothetical protein
MTQVDVAFNAAACAPAAAGAAKLGRGTTDQALRKVLGQQAWEKRTLTGCRN